MSADRSFQGSLRLIAILCLGPAVGVGVARFAYGLLLPSMRTQLHWSYAFAGSMNTANAVGYLLGAAIAAAAMRHWGARAAFIGAMAMAVAATAASAASGNSSVQLVTRLLAGVGGAVNFTAGAGLVAAATTGHAPRRANAMLGLYFAGVGGGIIASGVGVPVVLASSAHDGWRWGWLLLGVIGVVAFVLAVPGALACREPPAAPPHDKTWPWRAFVPLLASYFLFGAGYIAYMTFIVAYLNQHGTGHALISVFWIVLGVAALLGTVAWQPAVRLRGGRSVAVALAVTCIGALLPLVSAAPVVAGISAMFFGGSFLAVVTTVTAVARKALPPHHWAASIAALTTAFAVGQCLGPIFAGVLADRHGGLALGLGLSAGILAIGALVALRQRVAVAAAS